MASRTLPGTSQKVAEPTVAVGRSHLDEADATLMDAVLAGTEHYVRVFLKKGAEVNSEYSSDSTPLIVAVKRRNAPIVNLLLDHGADVEKEAAGTTPLMTAATAGETYMAELLLRRGAAANHGTSSSAPLICAASNGHIDIVRLLLDHDIDVNGPQYTEALEAAATKGQGRIRQLLDVYRARSAVGTHPPSQQSPVDTTPVASRGIATIIEVCSRNDLLDDTLLDLGISELKGEGTRGAQALAGLIRELRRSCRSLRRDRARLDSRHEKS